MHKQGEESGTTADLLAWKCENCPETDISRGKLCNTCRCYQYKHAVPMPEHLHRKKNSSSAGKRVTSLTSLILTLYFSTGDEKPPLLHYCVVYNNAE